MKTKTPAIYLANKYCEKEYKYIEQEVEIYVGMPCTFNVGTDRYPAHVVRISDSGKTVWVQEATYKPVESGFDYYSNQEYDVFENENGAIRKFTKRKYGWFMAGSDYCKAGFGYAKAYQDPTF